MSTLAALILGALGLVIIVLLLAILRNAHEIMRRMGQEQNRQYGRDVTASRWHQELRDALGLPDRTR